MQQTQTERRDDFLPLRSYAALGDGRSVALSGADGSIDWWCAPNMDSPPLFDRLLNPGKGGRFSITPNATFAVERRYLEGSNVHETIFITASGKAKITESINSGSAGRLPWCELARRVEGIEGEVAFTVEIVFGTRAETCSPYLVFNRNGTTFHAGGLLGLIRRSDAVQVAQEDDLVFRASLTVSAGQRELVAIIAGEDEPLVVPSNAEIDMRIDGSDQEWRDWSDRIGYDGPYHDTVLRSALALKLLLYSPSGAIAAAATTSLPERIGGNKNWDYRYAWVRDAGYTIKAFLEIGADAEAKAAFTWLIKRISEHGARVFYKLDGTLPPSEIEIDVPGYEGSRPVRIGNAAACQHQHGIYGDIFEVAYRFVEDGNILDQSTVRTLSDLADECADVWMQKDSGMWELQETRHYTMSKISCWQALNRAVQLADEGHLPNTCRPRWSRVRDRIESWIDENCWSERKQAYTAWDGSEELDAALALAVRFGFDGKGRLASTIDAIDRELAAGPFHCRYTGMDAEEGCFLACSFWIVEAKSLLGRHKEAKAAFTALLDGLGGCGIYAEMIDPRDGSWLGNLPQGLTHLSLVHAASALRE